MRFVMGIDPGAKHVGVSTWSGGARTLCHELAAEDALEEVDRQLALLEDRVQVTLVIEKFVLYAHAAGAQSWQPMLTSEMIGALKWIAASHGAEVVEQGADIKKPTRRQLKARKIGQSRGAGSHARDAELHLLHYLLKEGLWPEGERR